MTREEIIKYGIEVFNNEEEKFYRWYKKYNSYINTQPNYLIDTELLEELNRIEYGNFS